MTDNKRDFNREALTWDDNPVRAELAGALAEAILRRVPVADSMDLLDYGAGTGLVTLGLQPFVRSVTAADSAQGMLDRLAEKASASGLSNVRTMLLDLERESAPDACFDLIVSSMTFHHIENVPALIKRLFGMLRPGGYIAVADLDLDDGEFHSDPTGVRHNGFSRDEMVRAFTGSGLDGVAIETAHTVTREVPGRGLRDFSVFLIVGRKDR